MYLHRTMFKACFKRTVCIKFMLSLMLCVLFIAQFYVVYRKVYTSSQQQKQMTKFENVIKTGMDFQPDHSKQITRSLPNGNRSLPSGKISMSTGSPLNATSNGDECVAAVLYVRIYRGDKPELTTFELEQWIRYLQYAGVDTVYLYDAHAYDWENLEQWVKGLFSPREVTYHDCKYLTSNEQRTAYKHATEHYKRACKWHFAIDMDEYPFVINDQEIGFLKRFLLNFHKAHPECSELSFPNYIFSGYPTEKQWLIERIQRRLPGRANFLDKALYIANNVRSNGAHHNDLTQGKSCDVGGTIARMNHYWGARKQNWTTDTPETLSKTIPDQSILPIMTNLRKTPLISNTIPANVTNQHWNISVL